MKNIHSRVKVEHFPFVSYSKLFIPFFKEAKNLKKVLYSDVDVIFVDDIKKMYDIDLEGKPIGACSYERDYDFLNYKINKISITKQFDIKEKWLYIQSGNLIIDCEKYIECAPLYKVKYLVMNSSALNLYDQEILNILFASNSKIIGIRFCFINAILEKYRNYVLLKKIKEEIENMVIIHYCEQEYKPWNNKNVILNEYFWRCVPFTDFSAEIRKRSSSIFVYKIKREISRIFNKIRKILH